MEKSPIIKAACITAGAAIIAAIIGVFGIIISRQPKPLASDCPPECPTEYIGPGIVEAEECLIYGRWRAWADTSFSNGQLVNNEDPDHMGNATDLCLCFNFEGTGVTIIYRQDNFYGNLAVKIDGRRSVFINQCGAPKNRMERFFSAGGMGQHSLFLRGTRATGVITIDAIEILGNSNN